MEGGILLPIAASVEPVSVGRAGLHWDGSRAVVHGEGSWRPESPGAGNLAHNLGGRQRCAAWQVEKGGRQIDGSGRNLALELLDTVTQGEGADDLLTGYICNQASVCRKLLVNGPEDLGVAQVSVEVARYPGPARGGASGAGFQFARALSRGAPGVRPGGVGLGLDHPTPPTVDPALQGSPSNGQCVNGV